MLASFLQEQPAIYKLFRDTLRELNGQAVNLLDQVKCIYTLLRDEGCPELIYGLNAFMPEGYGLHKSPPPTPPFCIPPPAPLRCFAGTRLKPARAGCLS